jgi:steroid 5-alpha reductase family enzyme
VSLGAILLSGWAVLAVGMAVLWVFQRAWEDASAVDAGWAAGLGLFAVAFALLGAGDPARRALLGGLAGFWAFRLALYLLINRVVGKTEDGRYRTLREKWGDRAQPYFFVLFQVQALLDALFALPFAAVAFNSTAVGVCDCAGAGIILLSALGETLADIQLAAFRRDPANRGRTCRRGLWRLSRHPNYFFEWLHWFAYPLMAVGSPYWAFTLIGPAVMSFFLFKVTGIPATEAQALATRGEDYRDYQRTTSPFFPWFPKKSAS